MAYWLCSERTVQTAGVISRFDPAYWTVNFPRPAMAAATNPAPDGLRVDVVFYRTDDLVGVIWTAEDAIDHPLLRYEAARDFRRCTLRFRWRSAGVLALDTVSGPTLTIEGRDASGAARTWYVRLWNYASGARDNALVTIDFSTVKGGFSLPGEADPVWAGDIDRMFISLAPQGYTGAPGPLPAPIEGWAELTDMTCEGSGAALATGDVIVSEHGLSIATGYDDCYNLTPMRVLHNALRLGYRGAINHYLGMSHYFRLAPGGGEVTATGEVVNTPCIAWHRDFAARAKALGYDLIWSLSYELFDAHCPDAWKQRGADGAPALTGWEPPSALLSPANDMAMAYLHAVARTFMDIANEAGLTKRFQVGEPWWWVDNEGRPYLYDGAAMAAFAPVEIDDVRGNPDAGQLATLDAAGAVLAASTAALIAAAGAEESLLLVYLPSVLDPAAPEVRRMNLPLGWAWPAFNMMQLEDYGWVTAGATGRSAAGVAEAGARLGYPVDRQQYLAGFVLDVEDTRQWRRIEAAAEAARRRGVARTFIWALPQVMRDGFVHFDQEEEDVQAFDDVLFPLSLGREAEVAPAFSTAIATSASGYETRNASWVDARTGYDVGPGIRSEADIAALLGFFRARMGPARGFRLRDPFDGDSGAGTPFDQPLGTGDGATTRFALVKHYGETTRRITRPVAGSVRVAVGGEETAAFVLAQGGWIELDIAPDPGVEVRAGFVFDVPVRFAEDRLSVTRATFLAGAAPSVPLIEIREA